MLSTANESRPTHRLTTATEESLRRPFIAALRAYAEPTNGESHARLVETIIRTSRNIAEDDAAIPEDLRVILRRLDSRYDMFASDLIVPRPVTYREARYVIRNLFF